MPRTEDDELRIARAISIEAYAGVESALAVLLARLLGTTNDLAAIILFRITNTSARNSIIEQLLRKVHDAKYNTYWHGQSGKDAQRKIPGLLALIQQLDSRRNEIVHWHPRSSSSSTGERWNDLMPAYYWARSAQPEPITVKNLDEFTAKAKFVESSIFHFCQFIKMTNETFLRTYGYDIEIWNRIFEKPATYPPLNDHPLAPKL